MIYLKYIKDSGFIPGIPARDLNKGEAKKYGGAQYLVGTGLYKLGNSQGKPKPSSNKAMTPDTENKEQSYE